MHPNLTGTVNPAGDPAMDTGKACSLCEAPQRQAWVPGEAAPKMKRIDLGNYMLIERCPDCQRLWCTVPHEPYASFEYKIRWYLSAQDWRRLHDLDKGRTLHEWHKAALQALYDSFSDEAKEKVEFHRQRTYYHYNPIDLKVDTVPDLRKCLE